MRIGLRFLSWMFLVLFPVLLQAGTAETEPNDTAEDAVVLDADRTLIGKFEPERDTDFAAFEIDKDLHLWRLQLAGDDIGSLTVFDPGGNVLVQANTSDRLLRFSNLLLPRGRYVVRIAGRGGRYLFRAIDQGPSPVSTETTVDVAQAVPRDPEAGPEVNEIEPNDDVANSVRMRFGYQQTGLFSSSADHDLYRFSLVGDTGIDLTFEPVDQDYVAELAQYWGASAGSPIRIAVPSRETNPDPLVWQGSLPPGDYLVRLKARNLSDVPYGLTLDRRPFFNPVVDLEPNNTGGSERDFPPDGVIWGRLTGDADVYRLPVSDSDAIYRFTVDGSERFKRRPGIKILTEVNPPAPEEWRKREWETLRTMSKTADFVWEVAVPANVQALLQLSGRDERYRLEFEGFGATAPLPEVSAALILSDDRVAAFRRETQTVTGRLSITNGSSIDLNLAVASHVENALWQLDMPGTVSVSAGKRVELPWSLRISPDAWDTDPVHVSVQLANRDTGTILARADTALRADADAALVGAGTVWTAPQPMQGGLNLAWNALGGSIAAEKGGALIDGLAVQRSSILLRNRDLAKRDLVIDLAGDVAVPVSGVVLSHTMGETKPENLLRGFRIEASVDGESFSSIFEGELALHAEPQPFAFAEPVQARFIRLSPLSARDPTGKGGSVSLGELEVIGLPGQALPDEVMLNLADPLRGGHIVRTAPYADLTDVLIPTGRSTRLRQPRGEQVEHEFVVGFRDGRAAQIVGLAWREAAEKPSSVPRVRVAYSTQSPLGPWERLPRPWALTPELGNSVLDFEQPVWMRYVRITVPVVDDRSTLDLPDYLQVLEREPDADNPSALGLWTTQGPEAVFEWQHPEEQSPIGQDAGNSLETATRIAIGDAAAGTVQLGKDEDWYRFDIAQPGGVFRLALSGWPTIDAIAEIVDSNGNPLPLQAQRLLPDRLEAEKYLAPGTYFARIYEPPRSMIVTWDSSGSVSRYIDQIQQAVRSFSGDLIPDRDVVNFAPFAKNPILLLEEWSGDQATAMSALNSFNRRNFDSSNAELAMEFASEQLVPRDGVHAILVVTDLQSSGQKENTTLWQSLARSRARIFAVAVPSSANINTPRQIHEMFRDWTIPGDGYLDYLTSESRTDVAFRRAAAWLRRPASYRLELAFEAAPPEPALLSVVARQGSTASARAVEVVLDGSGSMLKRINGVRRYQVARNALLDLTENGLPAGTPFALRAFGKGGEGSCETDLELPLAPLDPGMVRQIVENLVPVNLAKTPIGASLAAVSDDLAAASGNSVVVLLTDGEETCGGDPAAEIAALRALGFEIEINIVGFALEDDELKNTFRDWASAGGGAYFDAGSAAELTDALHRAIRVSFELRRDGLILARGTVNGPPVEILPGTYQLIVGTGTNAQSSEITLENAQSATVVVE